MAHVIILKMKTFRIKAIMCTCLGFLFCSFCFFLNNIFRNTISQQLRGNVRRGGFFHLKISRGFYPFVVEWRLELIFDLSVRTFLYAMLHCLPDLGLEGWTIFVHFIE